MDPYLCLYAMVWTHHHGVGEEKRETHTGRGFVSAVHPPSQRNEDTNGEKEKEKQKKCTHDGGGGECWTQKGGGVDEKQTACNAQHHRQVDTLNHDVASLGHFLLLAVENLYHHFT